MKRADYGRLLQRYLRPQRRLVAVLAVILLGGMGLQLASPQVIRYFLDATQSGGSQSALLAAAGLYVALAFTQQALGLAGNYVNQQVTWRATNALRYDLLLHCLRLDLGFHKTHTPGELIERIDGDVGGVAGLLSQFMLQLLGNSLLVLGILALMFREDWRLGLGLTVYTAVMLLFLGLVQRLASRRWENYRAASAELYGYLEERIGGAEDIRAAGAMPYAVHQLLTRMRTHLQRYRAAAVGSTLIFNLTNVLTAVCYAAALGLGVYLYTQHQASIGTTYLIVTYVGMITAPLHVLREQARVLQQAAASVQRVQALFALQPEVVEPTAPVTLPAGALGVAFDAVSFRYEDNENVLHAVDFEVQPGKVLGVLGRTGSGKSTLTRLLFRLYDPSQGSIHLGGADLRATALRELRARVGMVTQDVQLFQASIRDNLSFFDEDLPDADLTRALKELHLWEWAEARPEGLGTTLATGGQGLSAGEAQLLAFARVFLKDPGLVILDEASSRLDPATETLLERAVDRLLAGRTAIIIAHRLRTVQRADDILILEEGRVIEYGPRVALAADPGSRFYHLLQTGLEEALA